jgi:hypothetical protein
MKASQKPSLTVAKGVTPYEFLSEIGEFYWTDGRPDRHQLKRYQTDTPDES